MNVTLVAVTQPKLSRLETNIKTAEDLIVYCARVSNPNNQLNVETGAKLLRYCIQHGHWSVFEQASMTVGITTSRAISAQILRHRSFHFQEFSQRYASVPWFEPFQLRKQAEKNRQSSVEYIDDHELESDIDTLLDAIEDQYQYLLKAGVARECARMILPMCSQTVVYMSGTVRDWIHYLALRTKEDTQLEHREIAQAIKVIFNAEFPVIAEALKQLESEYARD